MSAVENGSAHAVEDRDGWLVTVGDRQLGPYTTRQITAWLASRELDPECLGWRQGMATWVPLKAIPDFRIAPDAPVAAPQHNAPDASGVMADFRAFLRLAASPFDAASTVARTRMAPILTVLVFMGLMPWFMTMLLQAEDARMYVVSLGAAVVVSLGLWLLCGAALWICRAASRRVSDGLTLFAAMALPMVPAFLLAGLLGATWPALPGLFASAIIGHALLARGFRAHPAIGLYAVILLCAGGTWMATAIYGQGVGAVVALVKSNGAIKAPEAEKEVDPGAVGDPQAAVGGASGAAAPAKPAAVTGDASASGVPLPTADEATPAE